MTIFEVGQWYTNPAGTQTVLMLAVTQRLAIIEHDGVDYSRHLTDLEGWSKVEKPAVKVGQKYSNGPTGGTYTVTAVGRDHALVVHSSGGEYTRPINHLLRNYLLVNMEIKDAWNPNTN